MNDSLGDRMKDFEIHGTQRKTMRKLPICVRIDGRAFHSFTRGLNRPYDEGFARAMIETTRYLVEQSGAKLGYTQSDEISLIFWTDAERAQPLFGGKFFKLTSVLASMATAKFNSLIPGFIPTKEGTLATFDARVFQVPDLEEAANLILWRWLDARKNSISMAAQAHFSPNQLHGKTTDDRLVMLEEKGIIWENFPSFLKWGTLIQKKTVTRELTSEELDRIPEKHRPDGPIVKNDLVVMDIPPLVECANRVELLFYGAEPVISA